MTLLKRVMKHEGFRPKPYQDHLGNWTFGNGLTWISEEESRHIVDGRLADFATKFISESPWLLDHPVEVLETITEMAFQIGFKGTRGFKKMFIALEACDYAKAADEGLDSLWARTQTPGRARKLMKIIRDLAD